MHLAHCGSCVRSHPPVPNALTASRGHEYPSWVRNLAPPKLSQEVATIASKRRRVARGAAHTQAGNGSSPARTGGSHLCKFRQFPCPLGSDSSVPVSETRAGPPDSLKSDDAPTNGWNPAIVNSVSINHCIRHCGVPWRNGVPNSQSVVRQFAVEASSHAPNGAFLSNGLHSVSPPGKKG